MKGIIRNKFISCLAVAALLVMTLPVFRAAPVYAASGNVYTCTVNRLYQHPVTGIIEDSGGAGSYSIGQGMVEGCVYPDGILEVTDNGNYYLTIRMSLMDYTSGHTFWVQNWGDEGWSTPAAGITGTGTDSNGTTADICIQVPSENCIVRGAMYVEPMGRDVYWYMYPGNFSAGNSTNMNATMVTSPSGSDQQAAAQAQQEAAQARQEQQNNSQDQQNTAAQSQQSEDQNTKQAAAQSSAGSLSGGGSLSSGGTGLSGGSSSGSSTVKPSSLQSTANPAADGEASAADTEENTLTGLNSTIGEPAAPVSSETGDPDTESAVSSAQGLSLSTAGAAPEGEPATAASASAAGTGAITGNPILTNTLSVLIPGGILIAVAAIIVYAFRKNWKRWGGAQDDE